jgi:hypothetical protein
MPPLHLYILLLQHGRKSSGQQRFFEKLGPLFAEGIGWETVKAWAVKAGVDEGRVLARFMRARGWFYSGIMRMVTL